MDTLVIRLIPFQTPIYFAFTPAWISIFPHHLDHNFVCMKAGFSEILNDIHVDLRRIRGYLQATKVVGVHGTMLDMQCSLSAPNNNGP